MWGGAGWCPRGPNLSQPAWWMICMGDDSNPGCVPCSPAPCHYSWESSKGWCRGLCPCDPVKDLEEAPGSQACRGPATAGYGGGPWEACQKMQERLFCPLSVPLCFKAYRTEAGKQAGRNRKLPASWEGACCVLCSGSRPLLTANVEPKGMCRAYVMALLCNL